MTNQYLSTEELADVLIERYPEYKKLNRSWFMGDITNIATHFEKQGHVERQKFGAGFQSEITVSDQQREAIISLITAIDKFSTGDRKTIEEGRKFAQKITSDPNLFSELMLKAKEASPHAISTDREVSASYLTSILQKHPNSTIRQMQQYLEEDYDKSLTIGGISANLSKLIKEDRVASQKTKSGNVYRIVEEQNQPVPSS